MPLDAQSQALMQRLQASQSPYLGQPLIEDIRARDRAVIAWTGAPEPIEHVEQIQIPGPGGELTLRIYKPDKTGNVPVMVFFHGGGWTACTLDTHDSMCRALASTARCAVVSVDYRLAPEYPFPAAIEDAYAATCWVAEHASQYGFDRARLAVGGDSAGGNLAAVVTQMAKEQGKPEICYQLLIYPAVDYYEPASSSYQEYGERYFLTKDFMKWCYQCYLPQGNGHDPRVSPLYAEDVTNLPPALIVTAEYDPTRDGAEEYAQRLQQAGVEVKLKRYAGTMHAFILLAGILTQGQTARQEIGQTLRTVFYSTNKAKEAEEQA